MVVVFYEKETDVRAKITMVHSQPYDEKNGLSQAQIDKGIEIESMPTKEQKDGKRALPYINPQTKEVWYEYVDREPTEEEKITQLEVRIAELEKLL